MVSADCDEPNSEDSRRWRRNRLYPEGGL